MKRCPVCAELLADGVTICPYCGEVLVPDAPPANESPVPQQPITVGMTNCPICGESIAGGLAVCPICGESIGNAVSQEPPSPTPSLVEPEAEPVVSARGETEETVTCPVCGETISSRLTTCPYCSEPIGTSSVASPSSQPDETSPGLAAAAATVASRAAASNNPPQTPVEPATQYTPEPAPQPPVEPTPQYTPEPTPQYTPEPTPQYTPEPTPQYTPEPTPQYTPGPETPMSSPNQSANYGQYGGYNVNSPQGNEPPYVPPVEPEKKGSGMKWLLIALIALLALALGGALYYFLSKDKDDDTDEGNPTRTETTVSPEEEEDGDLTIEDETGDLDGSTVTEEVTVEDEPAGVTSTQTQTTNTPPVATPQSSARPDRGYDGAYDDVASGRNRPGGRHDRRPSRDEVAPDGYGRPTPPPHRGRDRGNSDVAPPNPGGTGFHLEPQGGRSGAQQGNNGPGFKLQQVDRIPNE